MLHVNLNTQVYLNIFNIIKVLAYWDCKTIFKYESSENIRLFVSVHFNFNVIDWFYCSYPV